MPETSVSMRAYELIDRLQAKIENASTVPLLSNKIVLEKDELLDMLDDLRTAMPEEIKEAKKIMENEYRIRQSARRKADLLLDEAREQKQHMIDANNITKNAHEEADALIANASLEATQIHIRALEYVSTVITKTQDDLKAVIDSLEANKAELQDSKKAAIAVNPPEARE